MLKEPWIEKLFGLNGLSRSVHSAMFVISLEADIDCVSVGLLFKKFQRMFFDKIIIEIMLFQSGLVSPSFHQNEDRVVG